MPTHHPPGPAARELTTIRRLAGPVVVTQLGGMLLGVVDTMMLGHFSVDALNASALGRIWLFGTQMLAMGILLGLDPIVSQSHGARNRRRLGLALQHGLALALVLSVPIGLSWLGTGRALALFGQERELCALAQSYAVVQIPGLPFFLCFWVLRSWLQGRGIMRPTMWVMLVANLFNAAANGLLIHGLAGFPRLGIVGAGIATTVTQVAMVATLVVIVRRRRLGRGTLLDWSVHRLRWSGLREILGQGLPVATHFGLEVWAFQIATLWAGLLGETELAGHVITLNLASVSFMIPLGISIAAGARIGNLIGGARSALAQTSAWVALAAGVAVTSATAAVFYFGREVLGRIYTDDADAVIAAAAVLPIAAAFQLFDGTQVIGAGILRGMGRTLPIAVMHLVAFYAVGLPVAWVLAFRLDGGLAGIWWGLCAGLGIVALTLVAWIWRRGPATVGALAAGD
ncbi:MAG: MATE family efflux transporter [Planctomycetota bacterium]|nr:MATE family efflux transporter [Planctomycetota bacterium]